MTDGEGIPEDLAPRRRRMLEQDLAGRGITSPAVLGAMARVRREAFVPAPLRVHAYDDAPLRIGSGQTISQPYVVAFMSQALRVEPGMRVLEIGTGSGYQTAVLAELGAEVFTVERHDDLSLAAERVLDSLGYGDRVSLLTDDGTLGWPEEAPFDRVLVTAAGPGVPPSLADQLREGGILVMPVGECRGEQQLVLAEKWEGRLSETPLLPVRFVPLVGREGFAGGGRDGE